MAFRDDTDALLAHARAIEAELARTEEELALARAEAAAIPALGRELAKLEREVALRRAGRAPETGTWQLVALLAGVTSASCGVLGVGLEVAGPDPITDAVAFAASLADDARALEAFEAENAALEARIAKLEAVNVRLAEEERKNRPRAERTRGDEG